MSIKRRQFNKLILAAMGGLVVGTTMGCSSDDKEDGKDGGGASCSGAGGCQDKKDAASCSGEKASCSGENSSGGSGR